MDINPTSKPPTIDEAAQQLIEDVTNDLTPKLHYIIGDAAEPDRPEATGPVLIAHVCNDAGRWGAGFTAALERRYPGVGALFCERVRPLREVHVLEIGDTPEFEGSLFLMNMVAQHGLISTLNRHPLVYDALTTCMMKVAAIATGMGREPGVFPPTIHCPRFGCGLAGGTWEKVEPLIQALWVKAGIDCYVYDLPAHTPAPDMSPTASEPKPDETVCRQCHQALRKNEKGEWEHFHPSGETRYFMHIPEPK